MQISERTTHDVQQGTGPWLRLREGYCTASEAPAALGVSRYTTRAELLRRKHTGIAEEHSAATLGKFAAGHEAEDRARPVAEVNIGSELYPVTMTAEVDGLRLLASLDGLTLDGLTAWETKLWNEELAECVRRGELPAHYTVQMDQELLVSGARRCLFTCTDGTQERYVACWYEADEAKFDALVAGWKQFQTDLAAYTLPPPSEAPAQAEPLESLPAVAVRMDGSLVVQSNLPAFGVALRAFVERLPKQPSTDTEFATTDAACKALKRAEEALDAAEANALASMTDVEEMRRMVADFRKLARDTRLAAEKLVERRKQEVKEAEVMKAREAFAIHMNAVNADITPVRLEYAADFGAAIKGLKTIDSVRAKLDAALAAAKVAVDSKAREIRANLQAFKEVADGFGFLFADIGTLALKPRDDFRTLVAARIETHKASEAKKEAERQAAAPAPAAEQATARLSVESVPTAAPVQNEPATLKLGDICNLLGFTLTAAFVAETLGVTPSKSDGASKLYTERQFRLICARLINHIADMAEQYENAEAA